MSKKYYISTAIAYASAKPHIGNTYEIVLADAIARYKRQQGFDVYFQTGTDEHGQKIEEKAKEAGKETQVYVDEMANQVKEIWDIVNTSYDSFVRTTNPIHKERVAHIFKKLYEQGDIYKGQYEGLYCTPCESFYTESQLIEGKCPDCQRAVKPASEEAYFLKLSNYADALTRHIEENPHFIEPASRRNEIVNNFIKPGLQDLCVSRTSFKWGVPVSFDSKHVIYVWLDALSNYITFLGYDTKSQSEQYKKYWPVDVHLIGKDILRFHTIYWPIMLLALKQPLPKQVFGHPWLLFGDDKMSKSKGNIVYADDLVNEFGVDAVRYYLLHEMPYANDGTFTRTLLIERINSDLANILGNLVNRTLAMARKYFLHGVQKREITEQVDTDLLNLVKETPKLIELKMDELKVADALEYVIELSRHANKYIDETAPWVLAKDEKQTERLESVIYNLLETIRHIAYLIEPFLPETSTRIFEQLNISDKDVETTIDKFDVNVPTPLFERIDVNKEQ